MVPVATYVFLDLETTGLPKLENNKTRITELSMVAVKRRHILDTRPGAAPRVQHKLTLCFNPGRLVQPDSTETTGLCNDLLEYETSFNSNVFTMINTFLEVLSKPVCLIAQNGLGFDFPILKKHFEVLKVSLSDDILCADSYHAFYDILDKRDRSVNEMVQSDGGNCSKLNNLLEHDAHSMQLKNETTPKQRIVCQDPSTPTKENRNDGARKARRRFPWSEGAKPKISYKLKNIYERLLNRPALNAHRAEVDCIMTLECAVAISKEFTQWVDENNHKFSEIRAMAIGVPLGD